MTINILEALPDTISDAVYLGTFANQSPEWHRVRAAGIGGSDVGTIVGCNPWESPYTWWAKRKGLIESDIPRNDAMEWGTRLEPAILGRFMDDHPELAVQPDCGTWQHRERGWQIANPDALYQAADGSLGIVEVKTARYEDAWADGVPVYYRTQVQWYLQTFGLKHAYVVVLFSGSKYREFEIEADSFEQDTNLATVDAFRAAYVDADGKPDLSTPMLSTYNTVRELHPDIDSDSSVELGELGLHYFQAMEQLAECESDMNELRARVLEAMGTAKRGLLYDQWVLTRQARKGGTPYLVTKKG